MIRRKVNTVSLKSLNLALVYRGGDLVGAPEVELADEVAGVEPHGAVRSIRHLPRGRGPREGARRVVQAAVGLHRDGVGVVGQIAVEGLDLLQLLPDQAGLALGRLFQNVHPGLHRQVFDGVRPHVEDRQAHDQDDD